MPLPTKIFSRGEVAKHNKEGDGWIIVNSMVLDLSKFADLHPGGSEPLREFYGQDATEVFYGLHRHEVMLKYQERLCIGRIEGYDANEEPIETYADISKVPFAEAAYFRGDPSPFWNKEHLELRKVVRKFLVDEVRAEAEAGERTGAAPSDELYRKIGDFGLLGMRLGPGEHLKHCPKGLPLGIKIQDFNYFHELITHEEVARLACPGFTDGMGSGHCIGAPPVQHFCENEALKERVMGECIRGEKRICLAITEPYAGSDVANVRTTAKLTPDGKFYVVNGVKKWITTGHWSQYFTTLVRTGGPGMGGLTMLLIERGPGVETSPISTSYSKAAGTAYIEFKDCKVPAENVIGQPGAGFIYTMSNFVHERWLIIAYILSSSRGILAECLKWCNQRKAFGASLLKQPVVRQRLAQMASMVEACQAWLELLTYEMNNTDDIGGVHISAKASLLKFYSTSCAAQISDIATNLMGGRGITATGLGAYVERFNRTHVYASILGGATDVMADAAIRLSIKDFPQNAKM